MAASHVRVVPLGELHFAPRSVHLHEVQNLPFQRWRRLVGLRLDQPRPQVIGHLQTSLDKNRGGKVAANLDRFYNQGEADRVPTFALMKLLACDVLPVPSLMYTDVGVAVNTCVPLKLVFDPMRLISVWIC